MNAIRNIHEVDDLHAVASSFTELLNRSDNADIAAEFPGSFARYTGFVDVVTSNLLEVQNASTCW
jgi:hypothetical protein